ncbi:unnamed protein product [Adineta ricciae]|uniref:Integrator complex subunit 6 n=1 Tax=Adineta ricciae TaxID=249248 RepID=A0A813NYF4_ADIRI|nr:unnamed protein product [Adineta ricciae]CAF1190594.1 unnamed protein product [Adineta ricciae]
MPVVIFLLDNSASMNQMTHMGTSLFDISKGAIEQFFKIRQRDAAAARTDRYMLLTLDEPPTNVKVGWKEPMTVFNNQLRSLEATGLTQMGAAIKQAFDLLNLNRHAADHDTYGYGRFPHLLEPSLIIVITDKQKLTTPAGVQNEINIPMNTGPLGSELTKEPFRWDQRLFAIVLALPANNSSLAQTGNLGNTTNTGLGDVPSNQFIPAAVDQPITAMCDVTGGRSYLITSQRALYQCLESLVQKIQIGVVVNLDKVITESDTERCAWHSCRKMITIPRSLPKTEKTEYNWPIPEDFWPSPAMATLPARSAHASIKFQTIPCPTGGDKLPFDKYELEPSPLTQYILERRQPTMAWPVFVQGSSRAGPNELGSPFGYLKASSNLTTVNLYIMPYNYQELSTLLNELNKVHGSNVSKAWQNRFDSYLRSIPPYYITPLRRVLSRQKLQFVFESFDKQNPTQSAGLLSPQMLGYLKKIRFQAKNELERWPPMLEKPPPPVHLLPLRADLLFDKTSSSSADLHEPGDESIHNNFTFQSRSNPKSSLSLQSYLNVFDIPRAQLLNAVIKLRRHLLQPTNYSNIQDDDALHSVPIKEMSNYDEYPRANGQAPPLREIDAQPVRQHVFGNPFKVNKPIDEIDELVGTATVPQQQQQQQQQLPSRKRSQSELSSTSGSGAMKKKRTPLALRNYVYRRNSSLSGGSSGPCSPATSTTSTDDELDMESVTTSNSLNRFSFDVRSVFDDDHRRLVKKYRETKKKAKLLFRRQADQEILTLLDSFLSSNESKLTLINELIYECQRLYPAFEPRLVQYKMTIVTDSTGQDDEQPSSSSPSSIILDDYM